MYNRKVLALLTLVFTVVSSAYLVAAQNKTNVSGSWILNPAKSKFEKGGPKNIIIKFDQKGTTLNESLTIANEQGEQTFNFNYSLDGKEAAQDLQGQGIKTVAKWEGEALIIEFKNDQGFNFLRKIVLSNDGKSLTIAVKQSNQNGLVNDTVVMDKQ